MNKTHFYPQVLGRVFIVFAVSAVLFAAFLLLSNKAHAAPSTGFEFMYFRIDTELDVLNGKGVTVKFTCDAETTIGNVTDGTASESTNLADGIVKLASTSAELNNCDTSDTVTASVSLNGWVTRVFTGTITASTSNGETNPFTMRASQDYNFVVNGIEDELDNALTLNGTTASISYSGTTASASYSGGKRYIAITDSGGTLTGGADGYVNQTVTLSSITSTASQAGDFGLSAVSGNDGSGLPFGLKTTLNITSRSGVTESKVGATVTAGDSLGVSCTDNSDGKYYCAIPLAHTATSVQGVANGYDTNTATYTDRTAGSDAQSTVTLTLSESAAGGGVAPTPTPTPTPTPSVSITPTPTPSVTPSVTPTPTPSVGPVKLYRKVADPKVYVQGADGLLTWVRTLEDFNAAGYKWADVQVISGPEFAQLKISPSSATSATLFRKANDPKVYVQGSDGTLTWVRTLEEFNTAGYNWADVKMISGSDFAKIRVGGSVRVVKGIAFLRVRAGPSTADKMVGKVLPGQELKFTETKNGWYKIDSGWVFGDYANEI